MSTIEHAGPVPTDESHSDSPVTEPAATIATLADLFARATTACQAVGVTPSQIAAGCGGIAIHTAGVQAPRITIATACDLARALGITEPEQVPFPSVTNHGNAFTTVGGPIPGLSAMRLTIFARYEGEVGE